MVTCCFVFFSKTGKTQKCYHDYFEVIQSPFCNVAILISVWFLCLLSLFYWVNIRASRLNSFCIFEVPKCDLLWRKLVGTLVYLCNEVAIPKLQLSLKLGWSQNSLGIKNSSKNFCWDLSLKELGNFPYIQRLFC